MGLGLNPQLLEAIYAQPNASTHPVLQALLPQVDPNIDSGALPSTEELLSQLESTNPTASLIAKYLIARQESENQVLSVDEVDEEDQQHAIGQSEQFARIIQRLEEIKQLRIEVEQLRERNDALAAALGACYLCWGEDPICPVCRGAGSPGFTMPDKQLFTQWVVPALHYLKAQKEVKGTVPIISNQMDSLNLQRQKGEKNE